MAGLTIQQDPYAYIAVHMKDGKKQLIWVQDTLKTVDGFVPASVTETSVDIDTVVYLRAQFDCGTGKTKFFYSTDNKEYVQLGNETTHSFNLSVFVGARFGIFNYATQALGGFVDVDWFTTEEQFDEDTYFDPNFEGYNEEMLTAEGLAVESAEMEVMIGLSKALELTATFKDGHTENVAAKAKYEISDPEALDIQSGMVIGRKNGRVSVKATYTDPMGNVLTVSFTASSTFFPWGEEYINTTLFGDGTYREATRAFFPGVNGQMGWVYENGVDMSGYKYLVLKLDKVQKVNAAVNIYPQNSIWGNCYSQPIGDATTVVIPLQEIEYTSGDAVGEPVNTANIMIVALYAGSNGVIDVSDAYLTNNDDYSPEGVSVNSIHAAPEEADGPIYNLQGMRVDRMTKGVYIRNGKKILVK